MTQIGQITADEIIIYHKNQRYPPAGWAGLRSIKANLMKTKNVEIVVAPPAPHYLGDGFRVHNFIPGGYHLDMQRMDPLF